MIYRNNKFLTIIYYTMQQNIESKSSAFKRKFSNFKTGLKGKKVALTKRLADFKQLKTNKTVKNR